MQSSHYAYTWRGEKLSYGFLWPLIILMEPIYSTLALKGFGAKRLNFQANLKAIAPKLA